MLKKLLSIIGAYKIYESWLWQQVKNGENVENIAIILDGNRRWASEKELNPWLGHKKGAETVEQLLEWCWKLNVKFVTLYTFSTENFRRDSDEVSTLMGLCKHELEKASKDSRIHKNKVRIRVIGHLESLPDSIAESAHYVMEETEHYDKYSFNVALAYGGREEIIHAIQKIADDVKKGDLNIEDIGEPIVSRYLYTNGIPDPDIVLRTSGEERISNFLLWQLAYSELYFSDVFWPAFQKRDFLKAIRTCQQRQRRFGI